MDVGESYISIPKVIPLARAPILKAANPWDIRCLECGDVWIFEKRTPFSGQRSKERNLVITCPRCSVPHLIEVKWGGGYQVARCVK